MENFNLQFSALLKTKGDCFNNFEARLIADSNKVIHIKLINADPKTPEVELLAEEKNAHIFLEVKNEGIQKNAISAINAIVEIFAEIYPDNLVVCIPENRRLQACSKMKKLPTDSFPSSSINTDFNSDSNIYTNDTTFRIRYLKIYKNFNAIEKFLNPFTLESLGFKNVFISRARNCVRVLVAVNDYVRFSDEYDVDIWNNNVSYNNVTYSLEDTSLNEIILNLLNSKFRKTYIKNATFIQKILDEKQLTDDRFHFEKGYTDARYEMMFNYLSESGKVQQDAFLTLNNENDLVLEIKNKPFVLPMTENFLDIAIDIINKELAMYEMEVLISNDFTGVANHIKTTTLNQKCYHFNNSKKATERQAISLINGPYAQDFRLESLLSKHFNINDFVGHVDVKFKATFFRLAESEYSKDNGVLLEINDKYFWFGNLPRFKKPLPFLLNTQSVDVDPIVTFNYILFNEDEMKLFFELLDI